ncbi:uncharacterized protein PGTG_02138 [Puccinia graminis f. sp. tritici CRL 75-36-700-3]|uniref:Secreted protein n=1 Tax=Puccinia graminis f. sp. tritici (strain CRL 75-36-700-3 / race SCCL) TaxID=418459 RepID=E3JXA2_PUCGT|nr:uncharacterized protein PGTG_02138 [Puccinia graminis f. sp. tritici CRL 75-36-700-3]EFP76677.2 hypothetical protein PGTG_02138 [Puccinia graminis f. sp. tritici CRL 75-36-700-3]
MSGDGVLMVLLACRVSFAASDEEFVPPTTLNNNHHHHKETHYLDGNTLRIDLNKCGWTPKPLAQTTHLATITIKRNLILSKMGKPNQKIQKPIDQFN